MKITAHVLVKNESRFIWYSLMSVISWVDNIIVWDTGSMDGTIEIIEEVQKTIEAKVVEKFEFKKLNLKIFDEEKLRQEMLSVTETNWFIVVDADEIWWDDSISRLTGIIRTNGNKYESIVVPTINLVGDMYHYQEKAAGMYNFKGKKGHFNLRAINTSIPGLKSLGTHGQWGWVDADEKMIQNRDQNKIYYSDTPYLHATHLLRSGNPVSDRSVFKRSFKYKNELGIEFPKDYYYPEVFFRLKPDTVPNVWAPMTSEFKTKAILQTPLRKIKRRIFPAKVGY
ncbi:glycosyltransferase family 2 protein [Candidatus Woesebacteria bacterium]|nr:glycosyltransferase family 2 protein [Candidatus Woesebacteria bacterium]